MGICFSFTDAPRMGDQWETNLDIDVLVHTRPPLLKQRDRYARNYGSSYAEQELGRYLIRGLKAYGYETLPSLYYLIHDRLSELKFETMGDMIAAHEALREDDKSVRRYRARERFLMAQLLDTPEVVARFVDGPMLVMSELNSVERMRKIYALRGARLGENIPFSKNAPKILADAFGSKQAIVDLPRKDDMMTIAAEEDLAASEGSAISKLPQLLNLGELQDEIFADVMAGLAQRLEEQPAFLDRLLESWVVPRLEKRYEELDDDIEEFLEMSGLEMTPREYIRCSTARSEWLALAKELGNPVPELDDTQSE